MMVLPAYRMALVLLGFFLSIATVQGFGVRLPSDTSSRQCLVAKHILSTQPRQRRQQRRSQKSNNDLITCHLVTEEDVIKAVEHAETMWAEALEARKTANALSDRAEEEAEAAASVSKEVEDMVNKRKEDKTAISMEQLAQADAAASANLDASIMVNKALEASEKADKLEQRAEEALQASEERLEAHLKDFPDSPLAA